MLNKDDKITEKVGSVLQHVESSLIEIDGGQIRFAYQHKQNCKSHGTLITLGVP